MNVEQVLLVLYHLVILLANDKKWPPKQFQALKEKLTSLETQMNGANGWGPPKDRSPSGCPGSLTLKNLQNQRWSACYWGMHPWRKTISSRRILFCSTRKKLPRRNCDDWKSIWQPLASVDQHPAFPVYTNPFIIEVNVSNDGLRTVLSQEQDGRVRPTSYANCALREAAQEHGELLFQKAAWTPRSQVGAVTETFWARVPDLLHVYSTDR